MNQQARVELRRLLARKGYSKSYIRRLLDELEDHFMCICSETSVSGQRISSPSDSSVMAESSGRRRDEDPQTRIGAPADIAAIVEGYPDLAPIATRSPMQVFVAFPAAAVCTSVISLIFFANYSVASPIFATWQSWLPLLITLGQWLLPLTSLVVVCSLAWRCDKLAWSLVSATILSLAAFYDCGVYYCSLSDSLAAFNGWDFSGARFATLLACWLSFALLHVIYGWVEIRNDMGALSDHAV